MKLVFRAGLLLIACSFVATASQAQGRIFGVRPGTQPLPLDGNGAGYRSPGVIEGEGGQIEEIDPMTGVIVNSFPPPLEPTGGPDGLAFDGTSLWYLASLGGGGAGPGVNTLYELDPDTGAVRDSDVVSAGTNSFDGLGEVGGLIYIQDYVGNLIHVFDPASDTVVDTIDFGAANPGRRIAGGFTGIGEPDALLATESGERGVGGSAIVEIDPATGVIVDEFIVPSAPNYGLATSGQRIYVGNGLSALVTVYSRGGALIDTFDAGPYSAMGGDPPPAAVEVPAASVLGLAFLGVALLACAMLLLRRRSS